MTYTTDQIARAVDLACRDCDIRPMENFPATGRIADAFKAWRGRSPWAKLLAQTAGPVDFGEGVFFHIDFEQLRLQAGREDRKIPVHVGQSVYGIEVAAFDDAELAAAAEEYWDRTLKHAVEVAYRSKQKVLRELFAAPRFRRDLEKCLPRPTGQADAD